MPSLVQSRLSTVDNTASVAFTSDNTAGNCIIVAVQRGGLSGVGTISDSQGNTYTHILNQASPSTGYTSVWVAANCAGGANTVTLSLGASIWIIAEYTDVSTTSAIDNSTVTAGGTMSLTTSQTSDLLIAVAGAEGSLAVPTQTGSYGVVAATTATYGGTPQSLAMWQGLAGDPGTYSNTVSVGSSVPASCLIALRGSGTVATVGWLVINEPGAFGLKDQSKYLLKGAGGQHSFTLQLRQRGQATIDLYVPTGDDYSPTRGTQFYLYDQTEDGTWSQVWTGLIQDIEQKWAANAGDRFITITGVSLESIYDTVYAPPVQYADQTCGAIVADLLGRFEAGSQVTLGTIIDGPILPLYVTNYEKLSEIFDQLAQTAGFTWGVTPDTQSFYFCDPTIIAAPWTFDETKLLWETADWKVNGQDYRNRQAVRISYDAFQHSMEFFVGAGQTTFTLMRPVNQVTNAYATLSTPNTATGSFSGNPTAGDTVTIGPNSGTWQALHIYSLGGIIIVNGYVQRVSFAGTSGSSIPTFATIAGDTVTDGTVIWTCDGLAGLSNGTDTYTFVSALDNTQFGEVLIGATASDTCQNLVDAINATASARGVTVSLPTWECAQCNAIDKSGTGFTLQQKPAGTGYVASLSSTGTAFSWSSSVTSGGTSPQGSLGPHEGATISLQVYEAGTSTAAPAVVYQKGSAVIHTATPLNVGSNLNVEYTRSDGNVIEVQNDAELASMAALTRGTGKYQQIADLSSTGLISTSPEGGLQYAQQALAAFSTAPQVFTFETYKPGLRPGMSLTAALSQPVGASSLLNGDWIVDEVEGELVPVKDYIRGFGGHYKYQVRAVNIQEVQDYLDFWKGLGGGGSGGGSGATGALVATSGGALRPDAKTSPLTTKGDIFTYDVTDQRLPVGTDGQILFADSAQTTGLGWKTRSVNTTAPLTGGGSLAADLTLNISNFTGDTGSGGAKGAVPAPASGDAAAGKFLKADGTWSAPASGTQPFLLCGYMPGIPAAGAAFEFVIPSSITTVGFGANMANSVGGVDANPTATSTWNITDNGTAIGTMSISTSGVVTFTSSGGVSGTVSAGHKVKIALSAVDTTLSGVSFTLAWTR